MKPRFFAVLALMLALSSTYNAQAQSAASISGVVQDSLGSVIPGASVVVTEEATGVAYRVETNAEGIYRVPALQAGAYRVSASSPGFKTAEIKEVRLALGQPVTVDVKLEVGTLEQTVTVEGTVDLINSETATVDATLNADQINQMPTPSRNALNAVAFLPGVNVATTVRESTINGLPQSFVSISIDGASASDSNNRQREFFSMITPSQDAVEAATVTLAAGGAQIGGGTGAVTVAFQTRSGTNKFKGSVYEYYRHEALNSNYYFNKVNRLPRNELRLNQFGGRVGGPVIIPGLYNGRNRTFFFFHYEQLRYPNSFTRTRTVLNSQALNGVFRYECPSGICNVNLLDLAARNGHIAAQDPTVMSLLGRIDAATKTGGTRSAAADPLLDQYVWQSPGSLLEHHPTARVDHNLTEKHRIGGSFSFQTVTRDPDYSNGADVRFPGAAQYRLYTSSRPMMSVWLRSTLSSSFINEFRTGATVFYGWSYFGAPSSNGAQNFEDQGGYAIDLDGNIGLTNWWQENGYYRRRAPTWTFNDTATWLHGKHTVSFGGSAMTVRSDREEQVVVPGISLGLNNNFDPARTMFTTANFPGASAAQLTDARELYGLLTGRVTAVSGEAALDPRTNRYVPFGTRAAWTKMAIYGGFVQDAWKLSPTLTITAGIRWDVQSPVRSLNSSLSSVTLESICGISGLGDGGLYSKCNFLKPGSTGGVRPEFIQLKAGTQGYKTDWNNLAPTAGFTWRPSVQGGFLRALLGDPNQAVLRAGWSVAYERQGMERFVVDSGDQASFAANPGPFLSLNRNQNTGLVGPNETWPVLISQRERLYMQNFPEAPTYPIRVRENRQDSLFGFAPDIEVGRAQTWTVGVQRGLARNTVVEVRYVGTFGSNQWSRLNWNAIRGENVVANKFLDEFKLGMANLAANNAAGGTRAGSFAYFGPNTGTNPLPIYLAYLNGSVNAENPAAYTGTNWTNITLAGRFSPANPAPLSAAGDLDGTAARRANAAALGYPANFFVPNPDVADVNIFDSGAFSDYHALQIDLRRRMSRGLFLNASYQYALERGSAFEGFRFGRVMVDSPNVRHAIKSQWGWNVPVGRRQRFGSHMHPVLNSVLGGWTVNGVGRVQARVLDFGDVRLVGMSEKDLQEMYGYHFTTNPVSGLTQVWMLPEDVRVNTRRAYSVSSTGPGGYSATLGRPEGRYIAPANSGGCIQVRAGDCGVPRSLLIRAPWFVRFDAGATKRFRVGESKDFEVRFDLLNMFNNINFNPVANPGTAASIFQVTSAYTDAGNTFDPGGRLGQLMLRFNW